MRAIPPANESKTIGLRLQGDRRRIALHQPTAWMGHSNSLPASVAF